MRHPAKVNPFGYRKKIQGSLPTRKPNNHRLRSPITESLGSLK